MRVRGLHCHLIGTEGQSPPLPYIEVSDTEGAVLIGLGHAVEVEAVDEAPAPKKPRPLPGGQGPGGEGAKAKAPRKLRRTPRLRSQ
jgi:hypothetical protein